MNGSRRTGILLVFAASCAHEVGFDSSYVTHEPPASAASGKLLLMMSPSDRELVYEGAAQSRRGADHRLIVPMGAIIAACVEHDADAAERAVQDHLDVFVRLFESALTASETAEPDR